MDLFTTTRELAHWRNHRLEQIHFVPTMGALHGAHQTLIRRAAEPRDATQPIVVVSVFVNPLQFGPAEDFLRYPRDLRTDAALAEQAGAAVLFAPAVEEMYPGGNAMNVFSVRVPDSLSSILCGQSRPGHFDGVATIVARLLALVRPDRMYLGEKDWQQLVILRRMVESLGMALAVEGCATVRDSDGLATSTRNRYLDASERERARALPAALSEARSVHANGHFSPLELVHRTRKTLEAAGLVVDYVELVDPSLLCPPIAPRGPAMLAAAVHCGPARLIDHTFLMNRAPIVAIDGPAGAGKSTVTRTLAARLGLIHLDTGAMYRAFTWWVLHKGADPAAASAVEPLLGGLDLQLSAAQGGELQVWVNGHNVTAAIRSPAVTDQVSVVAAHRCVREALTRQQREMGERGGVIAEGRDIGTAVYPHADLKVFLTATVAERARRRAKDLQQRGFAVPALIELEAQIAERDHRDSTRAEAPLQMADDAVEVVTDGMEIATVIQVLVDLFRQRVPQDAWPDPAGDMDG